MATRMRDRVFQQSLIDHGAYEDLTRSNVYDNGACQKNKGTTFAISRVRELLRRYYMENGTADGWAVHLDAKKYFPSTPHKVSKAVIRDLVRDPVMAEHLCDVIDSYRDDRTDAEIDADPFGPRGTGLGSPVSQLVQLAIPSKIDHTIKERFRMKYFVRYNDDVLMWHRDKAALKAAADFMAAEAAKLGLTITAKEGIYPIRRGLKFLRLRFILTETGKIIVRLPKDKLREERQTLRGLHRRLIQGEIGMDKVEAHYQSWVSRPHKLGADSAVKAMDRFYTELFRVKPVYHFKEKRGRGNVLEHGGAAAAGAAEEPGHGQRTVAGQGRSGLCNHDDRSGHPGEGGTRRCTARNLTR